MGLVSGKRLSKKITNNSCKRQQSFLDSRLAILLKKYLFSTINSKTSSKFINYSTLKQNSAIYLKTVEQTDLIDFRMYSQRHFK